MPQGRLRWAALALLAGGLAACAGPLPPPPASPPLQPLATPAPPTLPSEPATAYPREVPTYVQMGLASWYGRRFHRKPTASGERYDMRDLTAAHNSLPLATVARVTNLANKRTVLVRINDRGPYKKNRVIDVSRDAARALDMAKAGVVPVRIEVFEADQRQSVAENLR
jgi:rare lipoprotein A